MNKICYHLPGAFEYYYIYKWFIPIFFNERHKFYDYADIYCVYGCPAFFPWSGGRSGYNNKYCEDYRNAGKFYKSYNIPISITATNLLLTETDLYDRYPNKILEYFNEPGNSVVLSVELLHKYIREKYKNYLLISSTTKCLNAEDTIKEYNTDYDLVVLDYNLNNDWKFLNSLTNEQKTKTEFLINHVCGLKCPKRKIHYIQISEANLYKSELNKNNLDAKYTTNCKWQYFQFTESIKRPYIISFDRIQNEYIPKGFRHFKIEGRGTNGINIIYTLMHYFTKPEYRDELTLRLLTKYTNV